MLRIWVAVLALVGVLASTLVAEGQSTKKHRNYVPDESTAIRIAEAVLVAHYGEERVNALLPLNAYASSGDYWIVSGHGKGPLTSKGGGLAVWINKRSGCLQVFEHMK